jgi:hypothetical protein
LVGLGGFPNAGVQVPCTRNTAVYNKVTLRQGHTAHMFEPALTPSTSCRKAHPAALGLMLTAAVMPFCGAVWLILRMWMVGSNQLTYVWQMLIISSWQLQSDRWLRSTVSRWTAR